MRFNFYKLKSIVFTFFLCLAFAITANAQALSGVKTVDPLGAGPDNYTTLKEAIDSLNSRGVGVGGVTFNIVAGFTETAPTGGYVLTATGTSANPIIFQKSGVGANPVLTAFVGTATASGTTQDGVFALVGSDWVTIDGVNITDPNASGNAMMEYGYGLFKAADTNGCWNNTIKNCTITLNRNNFASGSGARVEGSVGIYMLSSTRIATAAVVVASPAGSNSNNKFYSNTIQNVNYGIVLIGYASSSPYTNADTGNDIGGTSLSTGNNIINYGGGTSSTNPSAAVRTLAQYDINVSYNNVNNNDGTGVSHVSTLRGIYLNTATNASATVSNNTVNLLGGATTSAISGIENTSGGTGTNNAININNNKLSIRSGTATSASVYGFYNSASAFVVNIKNNTVDSIRLSAPTATATLYPIYNTSGTTINVLSNTIGNISRVAIGSGTTVAIYISSGTNQNVKHNTVDGITVTGASGSGGILYGIQTTTGTIVVDSNTVSNLFVNKSTATSALYGIYDGASPTNENYNFNTVQNLAHAGTSAGSTYGIFSNTATGTKNILNNHISSISSGGTTVAGISSSLSTPTIANNNIYNITSNNAAPTVSGIVVSSVSTTGMNIYNNMISDLKAPIANATAASVRGINITATTATTSVNLGNNTVFLNATSSGAAFSSAALYTTTSTTATSAALNLGNNIFINKSVPNGAGVSAAFQRSSTSITNFNTASNNIFYAGVPSGSRVIYYDGTNKDSTLTTYKSRVGSKDLAAITEDVPFVNTTSAPYDLHISAVVATQVESGGIVIAGLTKDIDGETRSVSAPDIGADEGTFVSLDLSPPAISYSALLNTTSTANRTLSNVAITDYNGVNYTTAKPRVYYRVKTAANNTYNDNTNATAGWKYSETSSSGSPYSFNIDYSLLNPALNLGDTIQYFIVAQDTSANTNTAVNGAQLTVNPTNVVLSSANFPTVGNTNQYLVVSAFPSTVTVGSGGTYASLTGVGGLFQAINSGIITTDVSATILSNLTETGAVALNQFTEEGPNAGISKLTISPSASSIDSIIGNYAGGLIRLNGADRVTFDGSFGGVGNYLVFVNNNTAANNAIFQLTSLGLGAGADNNTITNCTVIGRTFTATTPISLGFSVGGTVGGVGVNKNVHITNNVIKKVTYGIYVGGADTTVAGNSSGLVISGNKIGASEPNDYVNFVGMMVANTRGAKIVGNEIFNIKSEVARTGPAHTGIYLAAGVLGARVERNSIHDLEYTGTGGYGTYGILSNTGSLYSNDSIVNNMITSLRGDGDAGIDYHNSGIIIRGTTGGLLIANNSVNLFGTKSNGSTTWDATTAAFEVESASSINIEVRNNIFKNDFFRSNLAVLADQKHFAHIIPAATVFSGISNNLYYHAGTYTNFARVGTTVYATLADFQTATGADVNSNFELPEFVDSLNLHINGSLSATLAESKGITIAGLNNDFDGDARPGPVGSINGGGLAFDIGADEFDGVPNLGDLTAPVVSIDSITPPTGACLPTAHNIYVRVTDDSGVDSIQIRYSVAGVVQTPIDMMDITGGDTIFVGTIPVVPAGSEISYTIWVKDASVNGNTFTSTANSFRDATLNVDAGPDVTINQGTSATLEAKSGGAFRITEFNFFNYTGGSGPSGNGSNSTWPPLLPTGMYDDNIEITNVGTSSADLSGYTFLVETGATTPVNYTFPAGTIVPSNGVVTLHTASGGTDVPAGLIFQVTGGTYAPGSGSAAGFILKNPTNEIVDAVATNSYVFGAANGVTSADWTGSGVVSPSGIAGATLQGADANNNTNWVTGSGSTPVSIGFLNPNTQTILTDPPIWTGGLLTQPDTTNVLVTPIHNTPGIYNYIATISDGVCSFSDTVKVTVLVPISPIADFTLSNDTALVGFNPSTITLTDNSLNLPSTWRWEIIPNNVVYVNGTDSSSKNPEVKFTAAGMYGVKLVVSNPAGSDSVTRLAQLEAILNYCPSGATATAGQDIGNVKIWAGIDTLLNNGVDVTPTNNVTATSTYNDYTQSILPFQVHFGRTYHFSIAHISSTTSSTSGRSIYIDMNIDGDFDDPGERVFTSGVYLAAGVNSTGTFTIPQNTKKGITRMRVVLSNSFSSPNACGTFANGETEDYAIEIINPVGDWYPPDFASTHSIVPPGGDCLNQPHVVSIGVTDTTGVDSVWIVWSINSVAQKDIPMDNVGSTYTDTIPKAPAGALVEYSFKARDISPQKNMSTKTGGSYVDAIFNADAIASADSVGLGETINLNAVLPSPTKKIGNGTTTSTGMPNPYNTTWWGNKGQYLILASELQGAGVTAGPITSLALEVGAATTPLALTDFTIKMGHSTATALAITTPFATGLTQVYSNPGYTMIPNAVNTHNFITPFVWDGTSNIIIETCFNNNDWDGSQTITYTTTPFVSAVYYQDDAATVCSELTNEASSSNRPNFMLGQPTPATFTWSSSAGGNLSATNIVNPSATPSAIGTYTYTVTANNGTCSYTDSVRVKVINVTPPIAAFRANKQLALANTTVVAFTDTSLNLPTTWTWNFTPNTVTYQNSTTANSRNPEVIFNAAGNYAVELIVTNGAGEDTILKPNYIQVLSAYCPSGTTSNTGDTDIGKVTIGGFSYGDSLPISNNTTANGNYRDYTGLTGLNIQKAVPVNVVVSAITSGATFYNATMNIFIDYNHNGVFDLPNERVFKGSVAANALNRVITGAFTPSISALDGKTLLRVVMDEDGTTDVDPCLLTYGYGETEDYVVNILPPPPGDYYPPHFSNIVNVEGNASCVVTSHTINVTVTDTTGVDSVWLDWSINGVAQPRKPMSPVTVGSSVYTVVIPANGTSIISYSFTAQDNSVNQNIGNANGGTYRDAILKSKLNAGVDKYIANGASAQLDATIPSFATVGTGTTTSLNTTPFYTFWGGNRKQYLYRASELSSVGLAAGPLTSINFKAILGSTPPSLMNEFTVYVDTTSSLNTLTSTFQTPANQVYGPVAYTAVAGNNTFVFANQFVWNGTSNIMITICWSNADSGTPSSSAVMVESSTAAFTSNVYSHRDGQTAADMCLTATGTSGTLRPNIGFGFPSTTTYSWTQSANGGLSATNISNPVATPTGGLGVYEYIVTANDGTCPAMDTVLVNVVSAPVVNIGGPTGIICGTTPRVLDAGNPGSTYVWKRDNLQVATTRTYAAATAGTYKVTVTNQAGLSTTDSIVLTVGPAFTIALPDRTICDGGTITVDAGSHVGYLWSTGATTQTIQITQPGSYHVAVTNASGCVALDTFVVSPTTPPSFTLGADQTLCGSSTLTLDAGNPGSTYLWSTGATTQTINASLANTYSVIVTTNSGCVLMDTVVVTNLPAPVVNLGADQAICPGSSVTLNAGNAGATFLWNTGATTQSINVTTAGVYIVTVTGANTCSTKDTVNITLKAAPTVNLGNDLNICTSDTVTLDAGNPGATYLWSTGATTRTIRVSNAATYSVVVTHPTTSCTATDAVIVTNKPEPLSTFAVSGATGQSVTFLPTTITGLQYAWNFGDPSSPSNTSQLTSPTHVFTAPGVYTVTLTVTSVASGCKSTTSNSITVIGVGNDFAQVYQLGAAPNPFVYDTKVKYTLPEAASNVTVEVYDMIGRKVATIIENEYQAANTYEYHYKNEDLQTSSGVYIVRLTVDGKVAFTRIVDAAKR